MIDSLVTLKRGSLYLTRVLHDRYLAGLETIVLLRRKEDLLIVPVRHAAAGGILLKYRNSMGDRVAHGADFFRQNGIEDDVERQLPVVWDTVHAALVAKGVFSEQT